VEFGRIGIWMLKLSRLANPLWGRTPGFMASFSSSASMSGKPPLQMYVARGRRPPSQGWKTFLHNHAHGIASMDLFVVPTISFRLLYGLLILVPVGNLIRLASEAESRNVSIL
jgi:hypothetical protein